MILNGVDRSKGGMWMKRQGFHRQEVKNGAQKLILWWNTVNDVIQQGMVDAKSRRYSHPLFHVYVYVCNCF